MRSVNSQKKINKLEYSMIKPAIQGDAIAINRIIDHYKPYISKLSTRKLFDKSGNLFRCIDEDIYRQLQTKLIRKILEFKLK